MRFSDEFLTELRARTDIEELIGRYTEIRHRGSRTPVALCPFHNEKTPSFVIYRDTQSYYCFGCGAGGDAVNFIRNIERLDYTEAVKLLCERAGMRMPEDSADDAFTVIRRRCYEANREAARFFHSCLSLPEAKEARAYIEKRQLRPETVKHFGLGYAPDRWDALIQHLRSKGYHDDELISFDLAHKTKNGKAIDAFRNRLMFPIIDLRGNVTAFGGRVLDDSKPKYLNSSDTPVYKKSQGIYALNFAKNNKERKLILCEGYMDVIAMHQAGFTNAVAGLGTAFTTEQISLLSRYCDELTLSFDSDEAGVKATQRALRMLSSAPMKIRVMHIEGGKDPDEIIKTRGRQQMANIIENAVNDTEFALMQARSGFDIRTPDGKLGYLNEAVNVLAGINNAIERDLYITKLSNELEVSRDAVITQVGKAAYKLKKRRLNDEFESAARAASGEDKTVNVNPEKLQNRRACGAEERILAMLLRHPDYYKKMRGRLSADLFITKLNKEVFEGIARRIEENRILDLSSFGEDNTNEQIGYLAYLYSLGDKLANTLAECDECVKTLLEEKEKKNLPDIGNVSDADFAELMKKKAEAKNKQG